MKTINTKTIGDEIVKNMEGTKVMNTMSDKLRFDEHKHRRPSKRSAKI